MCNLISLKAEHEIVTCFEKKKNKKIKRKRKKSIEFREDFLCQDRTNPRLLIIAGGQLGGILKWLLEGKREKKSSGVRRFLYSGFYVDARKREEEREREIVKHGGLIEIYVWITFVL